MNFRKMSFMALWLGLMTLSAGAQETQQPEPKVVYPKRTEINFQGSNIEGEIRNPGEFYFEHKPDEKMDSLVKRRKNFHREMLRDVVMSR